MVDCSYKVTDKKSTLFKYLDFDTGFGQTLSKFLRLSLKNIPISKKQTTIKDFIHKKSLFKHTIPFHKLKISDTIKCESSCIIAYPESDINEIYSIMNSLGLNIVPVVQTPWNRKLMGFVNKHQLEKELNKARIA